MTRTTPPTSIPKFRRALDTLLEDSYRNGIEVSRQDYVLRHDDDSIPDWEVSITQVLKPEHASTNSTGPGSSK